MKTRTIKDSGAKRKFLLLILFFIIISIPLILFISDKYLSNYFTLQNECKQVYMSGTLGSVYMCPSPDANQKCSVESSCMGGCFIDIANTGIDIQDVSKDEISKLGITGECSEKFFRNSSLLNKNNRKGSNPKTSSFWCQETQLQGLNVYIYDSSQDPCPYFVIK